MKVSSTPLQPHTFPLHLGNLGTERAFDVAAEAARRAKAGQKIIPFHIGDLNIPTPRSIIDATVESLNQGYTGYCAPEGLVELRAALARDVGAKRNVRYTPEQVSVQPGGKPVIGKFLAATMKPGDEVLYPNPGFPIYESQIEYQGGCAVPYTYTPQDDGFALDLDRLKKAITPRTRILILNNFHNPTAAEFSLAQLENLAELVLKHDLYVLSDDAYYEMQYAGTPRSIVSFPGLQERTVILYTCSKRFAMTGWRLGAAIGPHDIIQIINTLNTNAESCTPHFIQQAMSDKIETETEGPKAILSTLTRRRDLAVNLLNDIAGITVSTPNNSFFLYPDVTAILEAKGMNSVQHLMDDTIAAVGVSFCIREHYGRPLPGENNNFIRLAYSGVDEQQIIDGMGLLKQYFEA